MDCKHFASVLEYLERDTAMAASEREQALQHAESCAYCRSRLASARLLSLELRALAEDDATLQAPARVEASLAAAFRERRRRPARLWRKASWAGVAAAILLGSWLLVERSGRHSVPIPTTKLRAERSAVRTEVPSAETSVKSHPKTAAERGPGERFRPAAKQVASDTAGEFIALAGSSYPMGDGMVVRVELPRSAPALVGLPLAGGDTSGTVTADVVLGQDGVARAIRFVPPGEGKAATQSLDFKQN
jgi:hypothetical protein